MAYKSNQSYAATDKDYWEKLVEQEQAKTNAAGVQGFNSYQDMMNYAGTQNYSQYGQVQPDGAVVGGYQRPVASGLAGADEQMLSDAAYATVQNAKNMYSQATTQAEKDYWHNVAEQERAKAGYSGGTDGSMYLTAAPQDYTLLYGVPEDTGNGYGGGMDGQGGYSSGYAGTLDALVNGILNREAFSYNKDTDPLYQQYKDSYTRGGQRAMQDVLAQISARTGGIASSYATGASQQTFNNYMAQLADKVPELYQIRYNEYLNELEQQRADVDMVLGIDNTYYDRYRDTVADQQWQQSFDYNAAVDDRNYNYNANSDQRALAQSQVDAILSAGGTPSAQLLQQAGYSSEYAAALGSYYAQKNAPRYVPLEQTEQPVQNEKTPTRPEEAYTSESYVATVKRMLDRQGEYEQMVDLLDTLATEGRLNENQLNELLDYIGVKK